MRVLVIDDDRELCELIRDYLEPLGYETVARRTTARPEPGARWPERI